MNDLDLYLLNAAVSINHSHFKIEIPKENIKATKEIKR